MERRQEGAPHEKNNRLYISGSSLDNPAFVPVYLRDYFGINVRKIG